MSRIIFEDILPVKHEERNHDKSYWCAKGRHWVPKRLARDNNGKPWCPICLNSILRGRTREARWKHEERFVRY